jgi:hypothetical protein
MTTATKKTVTFIATQYKSGPITVDFYTKDGESVKFTATKKVSAKERVYFKAKR